MAKAQAVQNGFEEESRNVPVRVADELRPLLRPMSEWLPDPDNANVHGELNLQAIRSSLVEHGLVLPVVGWKGVVLSGNGVRSQLLDLGVNEIPVVDCSHMSRSEATKLAIRLNQLTRTSVFDPDVLSGQLRSLIAQGLTVDDLGWDEERMRSLLAEPVSGGSTAPEDFKEYDGNIETEHECPKCGYKWSGGGG